MAIGDRGVSDVLVAWSELARRPLEEGAEGAVRGRLDHLPGRADEVGRDERVLPRERRRVAGVVVEDAEQPSARRRDPADEQGVVCRRRGVEPDDVAAGVQEVAVRGERAPAGRAGERRRLGALDRLACSRRGGRPHRAEIRSAGAVAVRERCRRPRMRVAEMDEDPLIARAEILEDPLPDVALVLRRPPPAEVGGHEHERPLAAGGERDRGEGQRPVDAGREPVDRRPPRSRRDVERRRDLAPGEADRAAEARVDGGRGLGAGAHRVTPSRPIP